MKLEANFQMKRWQWLCCKEKEKPPYLELNWDEFSENVENGTFTEESWIRWNGLCTNGLSLGEFLSNDYFYSSNGFAVPAKSLLDIKALHNDKEIDNKTRIWGKSLPPEGLICEELFSINITFNPTTETFLQSRLRKNGLFSLAETIVENLLF